MNAADPNPLHPFEVERCSFAADVAVDPMPPSSRRRTERRIAETLLKRVGGGRLLGVNQRIQ
jgi:hypothetical protein